MNGLDQLDSPTLCLEDVLRTDELGRRPSRAPDYAAENRALTSLTETMVQAPRELLQKLAETARQLCRADSAGISILEVAGGREVFRWPAIAGPAAARAGGSIERDAAPCRLAIERDSVLLFVRPERYFAPSASADPPTVEALLAPFRRGGRPIGAVWAVAHAEGRGFDAEDARLLESLSRFAGAAYQTIGALDAAEAARDELERRLAERTRKLSRANTALRTNQERLRLLVENVRDDTILFLDTDGRVSDRNEGTERLLGYRLEDVVGGPIERLFAPEDVHRDLPGRMRREAAARGSAAGEHRMVRADGTRFWAGGTITALRDPAGDLQGFIWIFRDLTVGRATEAALREAQENLQLALSAAHMGIWSWDAGANNLTHDANLNQLLGLAPTATTQPLEQLLERVHPDDRGLVGFALQACARRGRPVHLEFRVVRPDGSIRWLRHQGSRSRGPDGRSNQVAGATVDITDLMETEEALRRARRQLETRVASRVGHLAEEHASRSLGAVRRAIRVALRVAGSATRLAESADSVPQVQAAVRMAAATTRAAERALKMVLAFETARSRVPDEKWVEAIWTEVRRAILAGEEQQRRRIARELHDQLGQYCASLIMGITALQSRLPEGSELAGHLGRLTEIARQVDDDLHRIALELRPTALDDFGLLTTLSSYVEDWRERTGIAVDFPSGGLEALRLPAAVETAAFRIVQEALNNVQKHARAGRVGVSLGLRGDDLVVIVEDDGRGFDPEAAAAAGRLGIRGMRERAVLVGGKLEIESSPGAGTMVYVQIPLRSDAEGSTDE